MVVTHDIRQPAWCMSAVSPRCNGPRYKGSLKLAILGALRMWGATRFKAAKSRFIIPDGSYNAARSGRRRLLSDVFPCLPYLHTILIARVSDRTLARQVALRTEHATLTYWMEYAVQRHNNIWLNCRVSGSVTYRSLYRTASIA